MSPTQRTWVEKSATNDWSRTYQLFSQCCNDGFSYDVSHAPELKHVQKIGHKCKLKLWVQLNNRYFSRKCQFPRAYRENSKNVLWVHPFTSVRFPTWHREKGQSNTNPRKLIETLIYLSSVLTIFTFALIPGDVFNSTNSSL